MFTSSMSVARIFILLMLFELILNRLCAVKISVEPSNFGFIIFSISELWETIKFERTTVGVLVADSKSVKNENSKNATIVHVICVL